MKLKHAIPYFIMILVAVVSLFAYQMWKAAITDTEAPVFQVADEVLSVSVADGQDVYFRGISANDNVDGDVTASIVLEKIGAINENHEVNVTYAAFDNAGNVAKHTRTIRFTDYYSPRFSLDEPLLYLYGRNFDIDSAVHVYDVFDGDISRKIKPTLVSQVPVSTEGIHQMLFRITNSLGDTVELQLPIEVYPTSKYNATLTLTDYLIYIPQGSSFNAYQYLNQFRYGDETISMRGALPLNVKTTVDGLVDTGTAGVYPVTYTVNFEAGLVSYTALSKLIVIVEG